MREAMTWIALGLLTIASGCAGEADADAGPVDAGASDGGGVPLDGGGGSDAGTQPDGSTPDAGAPSDGGEPACGEGPTFSGIAQNCSRLPCFEAPACVAQQLERQGHVGFTECGDPVPFSEADSIAACMEPSPFGPFPEDTPRDCGIASFSGTLRYFCAPGGDRVVVRFSGEMTATTPGLLTYLGHEFWAGSGGGSGDAFSVTEPVGGGVERFVGYQAVELPTSGTVRLQVLFWAGDLMSPMVVAGGFSVDVPPE